MTRFFCPGRVVLAGSHTDHQRGRIMTAAIDRGITAEAEPNDEGVVRLFCPGFEPIEASLDRLWPDEKEQGTSAALIRGMAEAVSASAPALRGFDAYLTSDLPPGQGLAASTAFALLMGHMLAFFSGADVPPEELARAAQRAEVRWFGAHCSLADAMACALGGGIYVDVLENKLLSVPCDFSELGLAMCLTNTGSVGPAEPAYAQIAADMTEVAQSFGEPVLAKVRGPVFEAALAEHKDDPKWMRARHFFEETWRVSSMADALGLRDGQRYMELMNQSGRSSEQLLKDVWSAAYGDGLMRGLDTSARLLDGAGAWRAHSGGYVQALMPEAYFPGYQTAMDVLFGEGSCHRVGISARGVGPVQEEKRPFPEQAASLLD